MANTSRGHSNDQPTTVNARRSRPVPVLGDLIVYLVKRWEDVVGKLNLYDRSHALSGGSYREAYQALFAKWRVENALGAEVCRQIHGTSEHAAKLYVFAKHQHSLVCLQCMSQRFVHSGVQIDALCLPVADLRR
jgi:hypothetical protein